MEVYNRAKIYSHHSTRVCSRIHYTRSSSKYTDKNEEISDSRKCI